MPVDLDEAAKLIAKGASYETVGKVFGVSKQRIAQLWMKRVGKNWRKRRGDAVRRVWLVQFQDAFLAESRVAAGILGQVARMLRDRMALQNLGAADLARRISTLDDAYIRKILHGEVDAKLTTVSRLALAMNCRVTLLFEPLSHEELRQLGAPDGTQPENA
jgi:hypothetical protein